MLGFWIEFTFEQQKKKRKMRTNETMAYGRLPMFNLTGFNSVYGRLLFHIVESALHCIVSVTVAAKEKATMTYTAPLTYTYRSQIISKS